MDLLNAAVSGAVVTLVGVLLSLQLRGTTKGLRREMDQVRGDLRELRAEVGALRADLTHVALAVGAGPRAGTKRG